MKQINKQPEPSEFRNWKEVNQFKINLYTEDTFKSGDELWSLLNSNLGKEVLEHDYSKAQLRTALVKEQFFLCCYCQDTIKGEALDTKVEHFLPKESHKSNTFDYQNLFAACNGGERDPLKYRPVHCDSFKGAKVPDEKLICNPLEMDVHKHFSYTEHGTIEGKTEKGWATIKFLELDCTRLRLRRKKAIEQFIYEEERDIQELIDEAIEVSENGEHTAFCMAIVEVLEYYR